MLSLTQIEQFYPQNLRFFKRHVLREYLQYRILASIFNSPLANKLSFLGGTALRIIYDNNRFSEDLDFDHFNLSETDFQNITAQVKHDLELDGYEIEMRHVAKGAYRYYLKIPKILFASNLSPSTEEKILIQLDTVAHGYNYQPDIKTINKFNIFTQIFVTPLHILLAQKIYAAFNRKRTKGRDFYDIILLSSLTKPDYNYLTLKLNITNSIDLKKTFSAHCATLNFTMLAKDVQPFLFTPSDAKRIELFPQFLQEVAW